MISQSNACKMPVFQFTVFLVHSHIYSYVQMLCIRGAGLIAICFIIHIFCINAWLSVMSFGIPTSRRMTSMEQDILILPELIISRLWCCPSSCPFLLVRLWFHWYCFKLNRPYSCIIVIQTRVLGIRHACMLKASIFLWIEIYELVISETIYDLVSLKIMK